MWEGAGLGCSRLSKEAGGRRGWSRGAGSPGCSRRQVRARKVGVGGTLLRALQPFTVSAMGARTDQTHRRHVILLRHKNNPQQARGSCCNNPGGGRWWRKPGQSFSPSAVPHVTPEMINGARVNQSTFCTMSQHGENQRTRGDV